MTGIEAYNEIKTGNHWLNQLARELNQDISIIDERDLWQLDCAQIALEMIEVMQEGEGKTRGAKFTIRVFPWEKSRILRSAAGQKVEEWIRRALIEKAMDR